MDEDLSRRLDTLRDLWRAELGRAEGVLKVQMTNTERSLRESVQRLEELLLQQADVIRALRNDVQNLRDALDLLRR